MTRLFNKVRGVFCFIILSFLFGSCGNGSNSELGPAYLLGEIQGDLAPQVQEFLNPSPWTGQSDGALIMQADAVASLTPDQINDLSTLVKNGHPVILIETGQTQIEALHSLTGTFPPISLINDDHFDVYIAGESQAGIRAGVVAPFSETSLPESEESKFERVKGVVSAVLTGLQVNPSGLSSQVLAQTTGPISLDTNNLPFQLTQSYSMPAEWSTCTNVKTKGCQDTVLVQVSAWMVYCETCAQTPGQPTDYFIMEVSPNVNTAGCKGVVPGSSASKNRSAGYWLRQFNSSAQVPGASDSDLTINLGPAGQGGYSPQDANPTATITQGTTWSLTGSGTAGPKNNFLNFGGGVSFVNQTTTTYQALTTEANIGNTSNGDTLNTASWTYDSWNYVNNTIRPSNHACGGPGLEIDKALPNIIYGGAFNVTQTWVWQAQSTIRQQFSSQGYLPVNVNNSMLLGWTFYKGDRACDNPNENEYYGLPPGNLTPVTDNSLGLEFDGGCGTSTLFGTIPLGHGGPMLSNPYYPIFNPGNQDNDNGNPGIPYLFSTFQVNVPFAPIPSTPTVSEISPTSGSPGTEVTITGTGLSGTTGVFFGGTAATGFSVVNDSTVTAIAPDQPAGTTTAIINIQTDFGIAQGPTFTYSN